MTSRLLDIVGAATGLVVLAPAAAVAALVLRIETRGPVVFRAQRAGRGGTPFTMFKLRTMHSGGGARITSGDDPRVTRFGRIVRRVHLDEWPQLWNVLRGDMALVGPRPEDPVLVDPDDPRWRRVLSVRPGITGPTQLVFARREARELHGPDAEDVYVRDLLPQKLASDVDYVATRSLGRDIAVLVRTLAEPFRGAA